MTQGVPPAGLNLSIWANDLRRWLDRSWGKLRFWNASLPATENGITMWDDAGKRIVVSRDGEWVGLVPGNGAEYAEMLRSTSQTPALANTAYEVSFDTFATFTLAPTNGDITLASGTDIGFAGAGVFSLMFSAQIYSTSAAQVDFWFWPKINGVDVTGRTIRATTHHNTATIVVSRSSLFEVSAGDVLKVMWAASSTNGSLHAFPATAFAPATPSVTLSISKVRG